MADRRSVAIEINGSLYEREIDSRLLLSDFIRHEARLTGTHVGCEHGICGACTVQLDGDPVRSCLMLAVQAEGHALRTVEALGAGAEGGLHPLQQAFHECHGLQCGFCTPGFLMALEPLLAQVPGWDDAAVREALAGNLCRCTGYQDIVLAVKLAAGRGGGHPVRLERAVTVAVPLERAWSELVASAGDSPGALRPVDVDEDERVATFRLLRDDAVGGTVELRLTAVDGATRIGLAADCSVTGAGAPERAIEQLLGAFAARLEGSKTS